MKKYNDRQKRNLVKDDYNAIASIYDKNYGAIDNYKPYADVFLDLLDGYRVVELGCGSGAMADYLTKSGCSVVGVDFSHALLNIARKRYPYIDFIEADICDYIPPVKYDGLFTKDVLFHLPPKDLERVVRNFKNILKEKGRFCIVMDLPNEEGEQFFTEELDDRYEIYYNYVSADSVKQILEKAGLQVDSVNIIDENEMASSYAHGVMAIYGTNKK
ncbi:MAG: class I SAM-dependent methyltransferase [Clostridia bacterium]|nr:class I SAM-dependent methyltransferase [Clostridia bacterium]